jgi:ferredoxin
VRIRADRERCVGAALCASLVPAVFDVDDEGKVVVLVEGPGEDLRAQAQAAVDACPSFALEISDEDG